MIKWNNLFSSLFYKVSIGYALDMETTVDRRNTTQENLLLCSERFLYGGGRAKFKPIYGMGRAVGKSETAIRELGEAFSNLKVEVPRG